MINEHQKNELIMYICGKLSKSNLDRPTINYLEKNPQIESIRKKIIDNLTYAEYYAGKGIVNLIIKPLEEIESSFNEINLIFPENIKNRIIKIGLINGVPMEYQYLSNSIRTDDVKGIIKHWKFFSNYVIMLENYFGSSNLTKGETMVLDRWKNEYNRLKSVIKNYIK
ncbi:MAG: hypothetical protein ACTSPY_06155 [Candidatus Helarchaeota archaeon]